MTDYGCKVCRVLDERELEGYDETLLDRWLADGPGRMGYRALARWLNTTMLRREMDMAGLTTLGDEAASKYDRLTADDDTVSAEVRSSLRTDGVPIDELEADFVSYGVVRTHLTECLGAERDPEPDSDWERDALSITRQHAETKAAEAIRSLENKGELEAVGDISVNVTFELECAETHRTVALERALRRGYISRPESDSADLEASVSTGGDGS
ncbi:rod-determining factor RdfA [Halovivax gelatinilyticus]|uniref:rod-determining factor RdfA n=1 Tax=Halovivax gelatinilyticus TaxID=2961597 RepID=UPI0020CA5F3F|nr:rod-determining factor RdfA [Halovivax gelatinilyticus]